jgi:hypothetical protein
MSFIYTRSQLKSDINRGIQGKIGMLISVEDTVNESVRNLFLKHDLRSAKRRATLTPDLYNGIFEYNCPSDLKGNKIIDIPAQAKRQDGEFFLTTAEEFRRHNGKVSGEIAIDDYNVQRLLLINSAVDSKTVVVAELDGLSSGASANWAVFGDGESLAADDADYVRGGGSLKFNISSAGGTTAGISNANVNSLDISDYLGGTSAFFVFARITSTTNLTSYTLRFGSSASVYHAKTVTAQADGTAFVTGWNLLRFDIESLSDSGTPDDTAITYFAIFMNKSAAKVSESDYKFDFLVLKKGVVHNVHYYTKYGWQNSSGTYIENSTNDADFLVADTDEYNLIVAEGRVLAAQETDLPQTKIDDLKKDRDAILSKYIIDYPSEAKIMSTGYYDFIQ